MIVALRAFHSHAQENLVKNNRQFSWRALVAVNHRGPKAMRTSVGRDNLAGELVHRFIFAKRLAQPLVQHINALESNPVGVGPQEISPFVCPVISISRVRQQPFNELIAFVCRFALKKRLGLIKGGQSADGIQRGAP